MKMMNPIGAGVSGTIVEVCAENAELVEFGAPLFRVQEDA
jgi:acetyl-CoA carboxylase biotin carboxyl carrier protein